MTIDEGRDENCVAPPGLSSTAVVAAADGEIDEQTRAHLQECPHCAARVRQMRQLQSRLRRQLYRLFCPTTDLLVDYCQGLLDPYQRTLIAHHLATCPCCAGEVALMESIEPAQDLLAPRVGAFFALRHTR
jgi:anti-sigma factor RsiW